MTYLMSDKPHEWSETGETINRGGVMNKTGLMILLSLTGLFHRDHRCWMCPECQQYSGTPGGDCNTVRPGNRTAGNTCPDPAAGIPDRILFRAGSKQHSGQWPARPAGSRFRSLETGNDRTASLRCTGRREYNTGPLRKSHPSGTKSGSNGTADSALRWLSRQPDNQPHHLPRNRVEENHPGAGFSGPGRLS